MNPPSFAPIAPELIDERPPPLVLQKDMVCLIEAWSRETSGNMN